MKIKKVPMVKLDFNEYEVLQILCSIRNRIESESIFSCAGEACKDCPFLEETCLLGTLSETISAIEHKTIKE